MNPAHKENPALEAMTAALLRDTLGARRIRLSQRIQSLWGGQGSIWRVTTDIPKHATVIVKHIAMDSTVAHPRGWNTGQSFARKAFSYEVEACWYACHASRCSSDCKVPRLLGMQEHDQGRLLLLEDLSADYPRLPTRLTPDDVLPCLRWLAEFHALFMHEEPEGLWDRGCYWHLDTRPDEWQAMHDGPLKSAAGWLDQRLKKARFQTVLHGDAKLANFCFSQAMTRVAAVDFQYVGKGCGMSDVIYFLGSCLSEEECREHQEFCLSNYFSFLQAAMQKRAASVDKAAGGEVFSFTPEKAQALELEWRSLYAIAWADFHRFLLGWMPEHPKVNRYGEALVASALQAWRDGPDSS